jgi:hypothetical protein
MSKPLFTTKRRLATISKHDVRSKVIKNLKPVAFLQLGERIVPLFLAPTANNGKEVIVV